MLVIRRKTAAEWAATTYIIASSVICVDADTKQTKYGDGVHIWSELPYEVAATVLSKAAIEAVLTGELTSHSHANADWNASSGSAQILNKPSAYAMMMVLG